MRIPTAERARVPRQCVISRGSAGPKRRFNLPLRKGNRLIFRCHRSLNRDFPTLFFLTPWDRMNETVVSSNC